MKMPQNNLRIPNIKARILRDMKNECNEIHEINANTFKKMIVESATLLCEHQGYLNSINVFPVSDGDTGSNLVHTMMGIKNSLEVFPHNSFKAVGTEVVRACLLNSRGNIGLILSEYFKGFVAEIGDSQAVNGEEFVRAFAHGSKSAWQALRNPQNGTVLDVFDAVAEGAEIALKDTRDIKQILNKTQKHASEALHKTRFIQPQMKKFGVVDAGGAGFLLIINGFILGIDQSSVIPSDYLVSVPMGVLQDELLFRYCAEAVLFKSEFSKEELIQKMEGLGDSLQIATCGDLLKLHIHTNDPELVEQICQDIGDLKNWKIDDMRDNQNRYHTALLISKNISDPSALTVSGKAAANKIAVVTDSSSDLPDDWLLRYPIFVVDIPVSLSGDTNDLAKILTLKEFYHKMKTKRDFIPLTSQPNVEQFVNAYKEALEVADVVFCLTISSGLSGAYRNAVQAKVEVGSDRIFVFDSHTISYGLAILINLIFDLHSGGQCSQDVLNELYDLRDRMEHFFMVDNTKYLARGGRLNRIKPFLGQLLHVNPLLQLKEGSIIETRQKIYFSKPEMQVRLLAEQLQKAKEERELTHIHIVHSDAEEKAFRLKEYLIKKLNVQERLIHTDEFGAVIGSHIGPGAIALIWT